MKLPKFQGPTYLLLAILAIATVLRLHLIDQPFIDAFSWRQASTAMIAENFYRRNWNIFFPEVNWDGPGPSYQGREFQTVTYIAALLYTLFGQHDWIGRSVAVAFGVWGIFALYQLVLCVWDQPRALASAAVMALLPGSIFIERSFLPDPAMVALVTTGAWLFVKYLQTEQVNLLIWASFFSSWGFLSKLPGLVMGIPILYAMLTIGVQRQWPARKFRAFALASGCVLIPVIAYYLWARHLAMTYPPYHFAGGGNWVWDHGLSTWLQEHYYLPKLVNRIAGWLWTGPVIILVILGLCVSVIDSSIISSVDQNQPKPIYFFHWWLVGVILFYLIGAREIVDNPWNLHLINPAAAALAGYALVFLLSAFRQTLQLVKQLLKQQDAQKFLNIIITRKLDMLLLLLLAFLSIGYVGQKHLHYLYYPYARQGYLVGLELRHLSRPLDLVMTMANDLGDPVAIYYSRRRGWVFPPPWDGIDWSASSLHDDDEAIRLLNVLRQAGALWLGIVGDRKRELREANGRFIDYVEQHGDRVQENDDVLIYRLHPLPSESSHAL